MKARGASQGSEALPGGFVVNAGSTPNFLLSRNAASRDSEVKIDLRPFEDVGEKVDDLVPVSPLVPEKVTAEVLPVEVLVDAVALSLKSV